VNTPVLGIAGEAHNPHGLLGKIDTISRLVHGHRSPGRLVLNPAIRRVCRPCNSQLIAIGASAGGPAALASILASLPEDFPAGLVVVQHVDGCFAEDLARWLDRQTPLRVRVACEGDCPRAGTVLLAGGEQHLVFADPERLQYTQIPANGSYRPSIDVFMNSVLRHWQGDAIGVLLTGMGHDGAAGLKAFRECGCATIAQDEATSVVYGMPKAAVELDAADEILPLPEIGPHLLKSLNYRRHPHV
jgi:two-component system response regulator WspF